MERSDLIHGVKLSFRKLNIEFNKFRFSLEIPVPMTTPSSASKIAAFVSARVINSEIRSSCDSKEEILSYWLFSMVILLFQV